MPQRVRDSERTDSGRWVMPIVGTRCRAVRHREERDEPWADPVGQGRRRRTALPVGREVDAQSEATRRGSSRSTALTTTSARPVSCWSWRSQKVTIAESSGVSSTRWSGASARKRYLRKRIQVQAAKRLGPRRGEEHERERVAALVVVLVLRDEFEVIRDGEPLYRPSAIAVRSDDVGARHVGRVVQGGCVRGERSHDEALMPQPRWNNGLVVEHRFSFDSGVSAR